MPVSNHSAGVFEDMPRASCSSHDRQSAAHVKLIKVMHSFRACQIPIIYLMKGVGAKVQAEHKAQLRLHGWSCALCVCVCVSSCIEVVYIRCGLAAFKRMCAVRPLPLLLGSSPTHSLRIYIHLPAKGRTILAFHFPVQGFPFFADKCSPIHSDRCHIASLPL